MAVLRRRQCEEFISMIEIELLKHGDRQMAVLGNKETM